MSRYKSIFMRSFPRISLTLLDFISCYWFHSFAHYTAHLNWSVVSFSDQIRAPSNGVALSSRAWSTPSDLMGRNLWLSDLDLRPFDQKSNVTGPRWRGRYFSLRTIIRFCSYYFRILPENPHYTESREYFYHARRYAYKRGICCRPVSVRLSVCLSRRCIVFRRLKISSKFFLCPVAPSF